MFPTRVDPLVEVIGSTAGHHLVALSVEVYDTVADLRFARVDVEATRPLARRVPPARAWSISVDGRPARILDAVGRGDRAFSNGEVRFAPPPPPGAELLVQVRLAPDADPLHRTLVLPTTAPAVTNPPGAVMSHAVERFLAAFDQPDAIAVRRYPAGTRTAADAAAAIGCDVAQIVKSLVFVADDQPILVLTSGANRVDEDRVATQVGADRIAKAGAERVREATGFAIGGTPPFGHPEPLPTLVDRDLLAHEQVWAAAGAPDSVFPLPPSELVARSGGTVTEVAAAPRGR